MEKTTMPSKDYATEKAAARGAKNAGLADHMVQIDELHNGRFVYSIKEDVSQQGDEVPARVLDADTGTDTDEADAQRAADAAAFDGVAEVVDVAAPTGTALALRTDTMADALAAAEAVDTGAVSIADMHALAGDAYRAALPADAFALMVTPAALAAAQCAGPRVIDEAGNALDGVAEDEADGLTHAERIGVPADQWDHGTQADADRAAEDDDDTERREDDGSEAEDTGTSGDGVADAAPSADVTGAPLPAWQTKGRLYILAVEGDSFDHASPAFAALDIAKRMKRPVVIRDAETFEKLAVIHPDTKVRGTSPRTPREPGAPRGSREDSPVQKATIELARRPEGTNRRELEATVKNEKLAWTTMIKKAAEKYGWVYHYYTSPTTRRTTYWLLDQGAELPQGGGTGAWAAALADESAE